MQKPFAYSPAHKIAQNFILTRRQILIIAVAGAILLSMISLEFLNMQYGESPSVARSSLSSSSELSTGMPREENASNKELEPPFQFNRNGKGNTPD